MVFFVFLDFETVAVETVPKSRKTKKYHIVETVSKSRKTKNTILSKQFQNLEKRKIQCCRNSSMRYIMYKVKDYSALYHITVPPIICEG
jgi:hypothetical protein